MKVAELGRTQELQRIVSDFGGRMALDGGVIAPGSVAVGDEVTLLE